MLGYRVNTCDWLRLWRADATESFDFYAFKTGDYYGAVEEKARARPSPRCCTPMTAPMKADAASPSSTLRELLPAGHAAQPR